VQPGLTPPRKRRASDRHDEEDEDDRREHGRRRDRRSARASRPRPKAAGTTPTIIEIAVMSTGLAAAEKARLDSVRVGGGP
jgi:hypothetical protein